MSVIILSPGDQDQLFMQACEDACGAVAESHNVDPPRVSKMPGFDAIDKASVVRVFMAEVTKHRELSATARASGEISVERHKSNLEYASYIEKLQVRITAVLNACPTLPSEEEEEER